MRVEYLTYATDPKNDGLNRLVKSAKLNRIDVGILGLNKPWKGLTQKLKGIYKYLLKETSDSIYLFTDSTDAVFVRDLAEVEQACNDIFFSGKIVLSAERNCYPFPLLANSYPDVDPSSSFRYVNTGGMLFRRTDMLSVLNDIGIMRIPDEVNDQGLLTSYYLAHPELFKLDTRCQVFQTMCMLEHKDLLIREGKLFNNESTYMPCVFHANGSSDISVATKFLSDKFGGL